MDDEAASPVASAASAARSASFLFCRDSAFDAFTSAFNAAFNAAFIAFTSGSSVFFQTLL